MAVVKDSFLNGSSFSVESAQQRAAGDWSFTDDWRINPSNDYTKVVQDMRSAAVNSSSPYIRYNVSACFDYYNGYFSPQGNGLIFVKNESIQYPPGDSLLLYVSVVPRTDDWGKNLWALGNGSFPTKALVKSPETPITQWFVGKPHYEVDFCLLQQTPWSEEKCQLEYSPWLLWVVCFFNLTKMTVIFFIWRASRRAKAARDPEAEAALVPRRDEPLDTLGDAIQSFMRDPDPETDNICLATRRDFKRPLRLPWRGRRGSEQSQSYKAPRKWKAKQRYWRHAPSRQQWAVFLCM